MARPKKKADARKSRHISLRLTETEYEVYKEFARRGGFTLSELIRLMMVNGKVSYRMPIVVDMPQLKEITAQLAGIGNNLNQIARHLHTGGALTDELQKDINVCVEDEKRLKVISFGFVSPLCELFKAINNVNRGQIGVKKIYSSLLKPILSKI